MIAAPKWILTHCQRCDGLGYDEVSLEIPSAGDDVPCCDCQGAGSVLVEVLASDPSCLDHLEVAA